MLSIRLNWWCGLIRLSRNSIAASSLCKSIELLFTKFSGIITAIFMARYVSTEEFGLLAIIVAFDGFAEHFVNCGISVAIVQKDQVDEDDYSSALCVSLFVSFFLVCLFWMVAPYIACYFKTPLLITPIRIYSFIMVINAVGSVQQARLQRQLRFDIQLLAHSVSAIIGGVVGIYLAVNEYGLWALIFYALVQAVCLVFANFLLSTWIPNFRFDFSKAKQIFSFGYKVLLAGLINNVYNNLRVFIVARIFSINDVAFYDRGKWVPDVTSGVFENVIQSVGLPVLSRRRNCVYDFRLTVGNLISVVFFLLVPLTIFFVFFAEEIIRTTISDKWLLAVPYMQVISVAYLFIPICSVLRITMLSLGFVDINLRIEIIRKVIQISILLYTIIVYRSVMSIAVSYVIGMMIDFILFFCVVIRYVKFSFDIILWDFLKIIFSGFVMCLLVILVKDNSLMRDVNTGEEICALFSYFLMSLTGYVFCCYVIKVDSFRKIWRVIKNN